MGKLKVGIIGAGQIAETTHLPVYLKRGAEVEVMAVADPNRERARQVAADYGIPHFFTDYREMLDACALDAVSVCTPNKFHAPAAMAALRAGCHVLVEKPPALTAAEAAAMAQTAREQGKILTFNFQYRFSPEVETLKRFVEAGELGEIYAASVRALRRRGIPGWGSFTNKELQGGGPLIDIGVHMLDVALYLMGYPEPQVALATTYQKIGNRPGVGLMGPWDYAHFSVEDSAFGMLRFKNGATLILQSSFALNIKEKSLMNVDLYGDRGGATVFPPQVYQEKHGTLVDLAMPYLPADDKHERSIGQFIDCCLTGKAPLCTMEEALVLQRIIDGFYTSAAAGKAVEL